MSKKYQEKEIVTGVIEFLKDSTPDAVAQVRQELEKEKEEENNKAFLYTFTGFTDEQKEQIRTKLEGVLGKEIIIQEIIDKKLLGGFKIKIGDIIYDASIIGQLNQIKKEIYERY